MEVAALLAMEYLPNVDGLNEGLTCSDVLNIGEDLEPFNVLRSIDVWLRATVVLDIDAVVCIKFLLWTHVLVELDGNVNGVCFATVVDTEFFLTNFWPPITGADTVFDNAVLVDVLATGPSSLIFFPRLFAGDGADFLDADCFNVVVVGSVTDVVTDFINGVD